MFGLHYVTGTVVCNYISGFRLDVHRLVQPAMLTWQLLWAQALFRRAQLKALVTMHSIEENYGGHLSATEINIIGGALDLTNKTAAHGMTPLDKVCPMLHVM